MHLQTLYSTSDYIEQNCHVLVTSLCNLSLACQHIKWKEILEINQKEIEDFIALIHPIPWTVANPVGADRLAKHQKKTSCI